MGISGDFYSNNDVTLDINLKHNPATLQPFLTSEREKRDKSPEQLPCFPV